MTDAKTSLYGGWPLTPSTHFPGETSLECPKCGGKNITLRGAPTGRGTGSMGRHRLGDPSIDFAECEECGNRGYLRKTEPEVECACCGKSFPAKDAWGDGDIGDPDDPSFCSEACYHAPRVDPDGICSTCGCEQGMHEAECPYYVAH